jgi:putative transposon-encoded protein
MNKKRKIEIEFDNDDEIIQREVKSFGNAAHIILPQKHKNKKAMIIIKK